MDAHRRWLAFYDEVPAELDYPELTLDEAVLRTAQEMPTATAFDFLGYTADYRTLAAAIERAAAAFASLGLKRGERIVISLPTSPQGVIAFYGAIRAGGVPAMIHPLSSPEEIADYLHLCGARLALTLDAFYDRFAAIRERTALETLVLTRIPDYLRPLKRVGFRFVQGRRIAPIPADADVVWWRELMRATGRPVSAAHGSTDELAAILFSGGTTGTPKGIMLSHRNFIAEAMQVRAWVGVSPRDTLLAILPIFHGFGLGALVNTGLLSGAKLLLVPSFSAQTVAKLIRTKRPTLMAGVPTLYEALSRDESLRRADLSCLRAAFSGADTLARPVKERFEQLVAERGGQVKLLEGYGLTEAVTAIMGMPLAHYREGSLGVPFPDMCAAICRLADDEELPPGEEGEICISGPAVMLGYLDNPQATAETLRRHPDGRVWLHTGDLGRMDEDGFFFFSCRLKRMIKSSGFNVYPAQVEAVLAEHPAVAKACVIGVPDKAQGERVKAFVVLTDPSSESAACRDELIGYCRGRLIKWSCPREIEFRRELPTTRLGKTDYARLSREERERHDAGPTARPPVPVAH